MLNNISIDCDCNGNPAEPDIHDIGILASFDPVAIDQAGIDLAFAAEGSESLRNRVNDRNGLHTLEHGLLHSPQPSEPVKRFLAAVQAAMQ